MLAQWGGGGVVRRGSRRQGCASGGGDKSDPTGRGSSRAAKTPARWLLAAYGV